jgi:hypothetical protein
MAARTPLFHGDRMCSTSEHGPPDARITLRVLLPIVSTAVSLQMPHSFTLENCSPRVVQCGLRITSLPPLNRHNYYQCSSIS